MSTSTLVSSLDSIPLPTAAPQIRRPLKQSKAADRSQALESNASESQSLVPDTTITGEYVENTQSLQRNVEPISRAVLSSPGTTMQELHEMATHELDVLDALNNEGRQIIKTRLMAIWEEMSVRFERGESINGISGTGGKGMGKYLRSINIDPAKRRSWKFEIRQQEVLRLAQENPPIKAKRTAKKAIVINSETEADLIAKAGVRMAQVLSAESMTPPHERVNNATEMAKDILGAIADGQYARLEPLPLPTETFVPETATFADWRKHKLPAPEYKLNYFAEASENFSRTYLYSFQKSGFKKIIEVLRDKPDQVRSNAQDFAQLATVLRGVAKNANLLAAAISTALMPSPLETSEPEEEMNEEHADQPPPPKDVNVLLKESIRHLESKTQAEKLDAAVEAREQLNPTIRQDAIRVLEAQGRILPAQAAKLKKGFRPLPVARTGKAHQRLVREHRATLHDPLLEEKQRLAADFTHARVERISYAEARNVILRSEYLGSMGSVSGKFCYGLFFGDYLGSVVCFGTTAGTHVAASVCGPEHAKEVKVLVRGATEPWTHKDGPSYLIARACDLMAARGYPIIVAYADPAGGEVGQIYSAVNFLYTGLRSGTEKFKTPDGKIHGSRQIHGLTRDRRNGELHYKRTRAEQKKILLREGCEFKKVPGKHRFVLFSGDRRIKGQLRKALKWKVMPPPRRESQATAASA